MKAKTILISTYLFFLISSTIAQNACTTFIANDDIVSITDNAQFIYIATTESGLVQIDKSTLEKVYYNTSNTNLSTNKIKSVLNFDNTIYVSTDSALMVLVDNTFHGVSNNLEGLLAENSDGDLVVVGRRHCTILSPDLTENYTIDLTTVVADKCCSMNSDIDFDADGNLWISHYDFYYYAVLKFDGTNWTLYDSNNADLPIESFEPNNGITTNENKVVATCWGGLFELNDEDWSNIHNSDNPTIENEEDNIEGFHTFTIEYDANNIFWVGTQNFQELPNKIAYQVDNEWYFLEDDENNWSGVNVIQESTTQNHILYAGTQNGLIIIDKNCLGLTTSDNAIFEEKVNIFPNPTNGILSIEIPVETFDYSIVDVVGRLLYSEKGKMDKQVDVQYLPNGVYYLRVDLDGQQLNQKFVKIK